MKITYIVPVCNPQAALLQPAVALQKTGVVRVIFSDDGTTHPASIAMLQKAHALGCTVLTAGSQAEPGSAAKRGLHYYLSHAQGHVGVMTSGLNMVLSAQMLKALVQKMPRNGQALVLGVRKDADTLPQEAQRSARARKLLADNGCTVQDPLSGVCLFSNAMARACVSLPQEGASWQVNLLLAACQNKMPVYELLLEDEQEMVFVQAQPLASVKEQQTPDEPDSPARQEADWQTQDFEALWENTQAYAEESAVPAQAGGNSRRFYDSDVKDSFATDNMERIGDMDALDDFDDMQFEASAPQDMPDFAAPRKWLKRKKK